MPIQDADEVKQCLVSVGDGFQQHDDVFVHASKPKLQTPLTTAHSSTQRLLFMFYYFTASQYYVRDGVVWSVGRSVCHDREPHKTAEPMEILFGMWTRMGARSHVLDGCPDLHAKGQF